MSPTSYQAAPPRVSVSKLLACNMKSRETAYQMRQRVAAALSTKRRRIRRRREPVEELLRPAHHPELLARDPLLHHGIRLDPVCHGRQRVDPAVQTVNA